jgi:hypothetical protein
VLLTTRALFSNRLVMHAVCWMTLTPSANGLDRAHLMSRGLVACLRGGRQRVLSAINAEAAWLHGLTSGSARWLMSRATAIRQSRDSTLAGSIGQGLDICRPWTLIRVGVLLVPEPCQGPILTRGDLGLTRGTWHAFLGASDPFAQGSGGGPDLSVHPGEPYLSLPRGAPNPALCGGVGCCSPCDLGVSYGCSVFILQKRVPLSRGTDRQVNQV